MELTGDVFAHTLMFAVGACFYSLLTLLLIYKMCSKYSSRNVAFLTTLATFFVSPFGYYSNDMFHTAASVSTFFVTLTTYFWTEYVRRENPKRYHFDALLGVSAGLAVLTKYHTVLLFVPIIVWYLLRRRPKGFLAFFICYGILIFLLLPYWILGYGFSYHGYIEHLLRFNFSLGKLFFDMKEKPFFLLHPLYWFALYGIYLLRKKDQETSLLLGIQLCLMYLFLSCWKDFGCGYSNHLALNTIPLLSVGLATAIEKLKKSFVFNVFSLILSGYSLFILLCHELGFKRSPISSQITGM